MNEDKGPRQIAVEGTLHPAGMLLAKFTPTEELASCVAIKCYGRHIQPYYWEQIVHSQGVPRSPSSAYTEFA